MAKLPRILLTQFGKDGVVDDFATFGSKTAGFPVKTKDIALIQTLAAWNNGWKAAIVAANRAPFLEDMNSLHLVHSYMQAYMFQEGIPEYDANTTYFTGSIVKRPGTTELYGSLVDNNVANALPAQTDDANWKFLLPVRMSTLIGQILTAQIADASVTDAKIVAMAASKLTGDIIDQSGIISHPNQSACMVAKVAANQNVSGGDNQVTFDTVVYDHQGEFNAGTGKFTALRAGIYSVTFRLQMFDNNPNGVQLGICRNGVTNVISIAHAIAQLPGPAPFGSVTTTLRLSAGDYIAFCVTISGAGHSINSGPGPEFYCTSAEIVKIA